MGQPVTVVEQAAARGGAVRFELNRVLTGTGHEHYAPTNVIEGDRPPDVLARRLFERGGIDSVHVNSNVVTVVPERGRGTEGIADIIRDLYTYYRPGVRVPTPEDFA
jgi:hypothetical protein